MSEYRVPENPVFFHINKNAGSSIIASAGDNIVVAGHQPASRWVNSHGPASAMFAVIRNPYGRVYSEYCYRQNRYLSGENNPHLANLGLSFDQWVLSTYGDGVFRTQSYFEGSGVPYGRHNMVDGTLIWFIPQTRWLCDGDGKLIVSEILRYETLESDWAAFTKEHGFECRLQHLNKSTAEADPLRRYTRQTRNLIFDFYRQDFDAYGYSY